MVNKIGYAYLDRGKTLHVVSDRLTAEEVLPEFSKIVEVNMPYSGGFPIIMYNGEEVKARAISADEMRIGDRTVATTPEIKELYNKCLK